jgi:hypothetical protein
MLEILTPEYEKTYPYKGVFKSGVEESIVNEPLVLKTLIFQTAD